MTDGTLVFLRAGGLNQELEVDNLSDLHSVFEHGESSHSLQSIVVMSEPLSFSAENASVVNNWEVGSFSAMIQFLNDKIYRNVPLLSAPMDSESVQAPEDLATAISSKLFVLLCDFIILNLVSSRSPLIAAAKMAIIKAINPPKKSWEEVFQYMILNEEGVLIFAPPDEGSWATNSEISDGLSSQDSWAMSTDGDSASTMVVSTSKRGRPRKASSTTETPLVKSMVRYCTSLNNAGFKGQMLPYFSKPKPKAPKATPPVVLQIEEMQRIGIEDCQINPDELSVEELMKAHDA
jgi:hypothetical protein